jgi:hypothetical protein
MAVEDGDAGRGLAEQSVGRRFLRRQFRLVDEDDRVILGGEEGQITRDLLEGRDAWLNGSVVDEVEAMTVPAAEEEVLHAPAAVRERNAAQMQRSCTGRSSEDEEQRD